MNNFRSPLAKARGLGSSPDASHHFWVQRVSALALVPLVLWLCIGIARLPSLEHAQLVQWLAYPLNAVMMVLLVIMSLHHGQLGVQVIIEDYISTHKYRLIWLLLIKLLSYLLMVAGVFAVLKIALGGS